MVRTAKKFIRRHVTTKRRSKNSVTSNQVVFNKIDFLLILLMKKLKQDHNNKEFYISSFEAVIKDIHNFNINKGNTTHGGGNLKSSLYKLFVLVMSLKTTLGTSVIPYENLNSNIIHNTKQINVVGEIPTFDNFLFYSEHENILRYKTNNYIVSAIESLNKQYVTTITNGKSHLSSAAKITNMCRDVFLRDSVQKLITPPKKSSYSFSTSLVPPIDETKVDYDTLCELSFPIPRFVVDDRDKTLKIEITKSIGYNKIADMLETLYDNIDNNLEDDIILKISKLKYLIKSVRYIEDSAKESSDLLTKFHNIHERISNYFNTFQNIETMVGDPELHFGSIKKGLKAAFDTNILQQETKQNEILSKAKIESYVLPFFSGVSSVTDSSIGYFTNSVNNVITGLNIDTYLFNLITLVLGAAVLCVGISSCANRQNKGICDNHDIHSLRDEFTMLKQSLKETQDNQLNYSNHTPIEKIEKIKVSPPERKRSSDDTRCVSKLDRPTSGSNRGEDVKRNNDNEKIRKVEKIEKNEENHDNEKVQKDSSQKLPRCPKGERRNKKTLKCTPYKKSVNKV